MKNTFKTKTMADVKFIDGLRVFKPNAQAPDWIKAQLKINKQELMAYLNQSSEDEITVDLKESKSGNLYCSLNEFKPKPQTHNTARDGDDNFPF